MIRRILNIVLWLVLGFWFLGILGFVSKSNHAVVCNEIRISISDSSNTRFVTETALREDIANSEYNTQGYQAGEIRTREIEHWLEEDPYVRNAEVYINVEGVLFADIIQRKPILRIMPGGREGFFVDSEGVIMPLSEEYSPMVLLATGSVNVKLEEGDSGVKRLDMSKDSEAKLLMDLAEYIQNDAFWSRQIMQLYRTSGGDYEIIPRVGAHQIVLGGLEGHRTKLRNLKLLYKKGFSQYGWNTYDKINLKYSNQIICSKR